MVVCLCVNHVSAQWVVSDPALTQLSQITWAKELKQAYEQFEVLDKSRNILTESLDLYRQVSGVIKNSKMVLNVLLSRLQKCLKTFVLKSHLTGYL